MRETDFDAFSAMLDDVHALLPRGTAQPLSASARAMFFRALLPYDLAAVRGALDAHVRDPQRGRFAPVPADLIAQLGSAAADDGRPGTDEAWSIAVLGVDEAATVVWTDEIAEAWGVARPVMAIGDEVGARLAFREAYTRLVRAARKAGAPVRWTASLGHDPEGRDRALREAARLGRIADSPSGAAALPAPRAELLPAPNDGTHAPNAEVRAMLLALRERMANPPEVPSKAEIERAELAAKKAAVAQAVEAYSKGGE